VLFDPDEVVGGRMLERIEGNELPRAPFEAALVVLRRAERVTRPASDASEPTRARATATAATAALRPPDGCAART